LIPNIEINNITNFDYFKYLNNNNKIEKKYIDKYILSISKEFSLLLNKIYDFLFVTVIYTISWIEFYKIKKINNYYEHLNNVLNFIWNNF
jgi:hypothetical protein